MKLIALLLIINSHSDALFPNKIRVLATGGAIGNAIFFAASGYLTRIKYGITWKDIANRFIRLYLPVYLFCLVMGRYTPSSLSDMHKAFQLFIWPTPYWFVSASFVYYVLLLIMKKLGLTKPKYFASVFVAFLVVYFLCYIFGINDKNTWAVEDANISGTMIPFKCIYTFFIYYTCFCIRENGFKISGKTSGMVMLVSFILTYLVKFLMQKDIVPMSWQILNQFTVMPCAIWSVCLAEACEEAFSRLPQRVIKCINSLSAISLESYIVQGTIIASVASRNIMFPLNLVLVMIIVLMCAYILRIIDIKITTRITFR